MSYLRAHTFFAVIDMNTLQCVYKFIKKRHPLPNFHVEEVKMGVIFLRHKNSIFGI